MTSGRSNSPISEVNMLYPVSSKLGLREEGHKVLKRKVHQILVKNGKTEFIWGTAVEKRDFNTELSSAAETVRASVELQPGGKVDGRVIRETWWNTGGEGRGTWLDIKDGGLSSKFLYFWHPVTGEHLWLSWLSRSRTRPSQEECSEDSSWLRR